MKLADSPTWGSFTSDLDGWEDTELVDASELIVDVDSLNADSVVDKINVQREKRQDFRAVMALNEASSITDILFLSFNLLGYGFNVCFYISEMISNFVDGDKHPSLSHESTRTMFDTTSLILDAVKSWHLSWNGDNLEAKCGGYLNPKSSFQTKCNPSVDIPPDFKILIIDIVDKFLIVDHFSFTKSQLITQSDVAEHFTRDPRPMYLRHNLVAHLQEENPAISKTQFCWEHELELLAQKKLLFVTNKHVFAQQLDEFIDSGGKESAFVLLDEGSPMNFHKYEYKFGTLVETLKLKSGFASTDGLLILKTL